MKRIVCLLCAILIAISCLPPVPITALAADIVDSGTCGDNLTWALDSEGTLTISGAGGMYDYHEDNFAPWQNKSVKSVVIEQGVTRIGDYAFYDQWNLIYITIPDSLNAVGWLAFSGCTNLEYSVYENGEYLGNVNNPYLYFAGPISKDITMCSIFAHTKIIGGEAFAGCTNLSYVEIPDSVIYICDYAFEDCNSLNYNIYDNGKYLGSKSNPYLYFADTVSDNITSCSIHENTKIIGSKAFYECRSLTSIYISDSVVAIGVQAFDKCSGLKGLDIPDSVAVIGTLAFYECSGLNRLDIPDSVIAIGRSAFQYCTSVTNIKIGSGITQILQETFSDCRDLVSVDCGENVRYMEWLAFGWCDEIESVTLYSNIVNICGAFDCTNLKCVYYEGTETQWNATAKSAYEFSYVEMHYNHTHNYSLFEPVEVIPTCVEKGYKEYTCIYGEKYREYISSLGHNYSGSTVTVQPNCTEAGYIGRKCTRCDDVHTDTVLDSYGHNVVVVPAKEPTCTEKGNTTGTVCQRCNTWFIQPTYIDTVGHSFTNYVNNCDGTMTAVCDNCDATETIDEKAAAIGATLYATLDDALAAAQAGETIKLLFDVQVEDIILTNGIIIDLNGCTLTVDALTAFAEGLADGYIVDSSEGNTGLLIVEKEKATFKSNNPDMPLYDEKNGGYRFFDYKLTLHSKPTNVDTGKEKFWFKFHFYTDATCTELDSDAYGIVAAGGSGMEVRTALTWKGNELPKVLFAKDGSADAFVKDWADDAIAARWLYVIVSGLDKVGDGTLTVTPQITANGVTAENGKITYIKGHVKPETDYGWSDGIQ